MKLLFFTFNCYLIQLPNILFFGEMKDNFFLVD